MWPKMESSEDNGARVWSWYFSYFSFTTLLVSNIACLVLIPLQKKGNKWKVVWLANKMFRVNVCRCFVLKYSLCFSVRKSRHQWSLLIGIYYCSIFWASEYMFLVYTDLVAAEIFPSFSYSAFSSSSPIPFPGNFFPGHFCHVILDRQSSSSMPYIHTTLIHLKA